MDKLSKGKRDGIEYITLLSGIRIRTFLPGDASYVSCMHMRLYDRMYNFNPIFEHYVMKSMVDFVKDHTGGEMWVALDGDEIIGSISMVRSDEPETVQLRWFIMEEGYQGKGVGRALMDVALGFAREQGYRKVLLWTADMLPAAHHLYKQYGFVLTQEVPNTDWTDKEVNEERWDLTL